MMNNKETNDYSCNISLIIDLPKLIKRLDGDKKLVRKMLTAYCMDMPKKLDTLRQAIEEGDIRQIRMRADNIRGASVNINANLIAKTSLKVEQAILKGNLQEATTLFNRVEAEFKRLHEIVTNLFVLSAL